MKRNTIKNFLLLLPVVMFWYIGLFLTVLLWYPAGLSDSEWQIHVLHFSIVYLLWLAVFFTYSLFDLQILHSARTMLVRIFGATIICILIAITYFYFQPQLLLTPRRFLLVHVMISSIGILIWYWFLHKISPKIWQSIIYYHKSLPNDSGLELLISEHGYAGLKYQGLLDHKSISQSSEDGVIVVLPDHNLLTVEAEQDLFALRREGVQFVNYHELYENLTRTIHLSVLSESWFIRSVDYSAHEFFDLIKRALDIALALIGFLVFAITFPVIGLLIKLTSRGPIFFTQPRVGQLGKTFTVFKYRTMQTSTENNIWTSPKDARITLLGKFLRTTRLDELPQSINILKGEMSIVGPRPEQVGIVEEMRKLIPYYDERHIVKPGLTGWAQLHVYASSVEETRRKLQYDLYYIKHRSLVFDFEIILKTIYNILAFQGR